LGYGHSTPDIRGVLGTVINNSQLRCYDESQRRTRVTDTLERFRLPYWRHRRVVGA